MPRHGPYNSMILVRGVGVPDEGSPQSPSARFSSDDEAELVVEIVALVVDCYGGDKRRVFLTGLSMGGYGTYAIAALLAMPAGTPPTTRRNCTHNVKSSLEQLNALAQTFERVLESWAKTTPENTIFSPPSDKCTTWKRKLKLFCRVGPGVTAGSPLPPTPSSSAPSLESSELSYPFLSDLGSSSTPSVFHVSIPQL